MYIHFHTVTVTPVHLEYNASLAVAMVAIGHDMLSGTQLVIMP